MTKYDPTRVYYRRENAEGTMEWSLYAITNNMEDADKLADELADCDDVLEIKITSDDPRCYEDFDHGDVPEIENPYDEDRVFDSEFESESMSPLFIEYLVSCGLTPTVARKLYMESKRAMSA